MDMCQTAVRCALLLTVQLSLAAWFALAWFGVPVRADPAAAGGEVERYQRRLEELFRRLDRNGDGRLDREEARANPYLQRHFERLDRSGKGFLVPADLVPSDQRR